MILTIKRLNARIIVKTALMRKAGGCLAVCLAVCAAPAAIAFNDLSVAQKLIYTEPHLHDTSEGQTVVYEYQAVSPDEDDVTDTVTLNVSKVLDDGGRNVSLEFLTDTRRLMLPDFDGYKGNPVVIAMLEHIAQASGRDTGGGALYFRNRIRDALAEKELEVKEGHREFAGKKIPMQEIMIMPFVGDKYLKGNMRYENMQYRLVFSKDVPAGVLEITVATAGDDGKVIASRSLKLVPANM